MSVGKACDLTMPNQSLPEPSPPGRVMDVVRLSVLNQDRVLCALNTRFPGFSAFRFSSSAAGVFRYCGLRCYKVSEQRTNLPWRWFLQKEMECIKFRPIGSKWALLLWCAPVCLAAWQCPANTWRGRSAAGKGIVVGYLGLKKAQLSSGEIHMPCA